MMGTQRAPPLARTQRWGHVLFHRADWLLFEGAIKLEEKGVSCSNVMTFLVIIVVPGRSCKMSPDFIVQIKNNVHLARFSNGRQLDESRKFSLLLALLQDKTVWIFPQRGQTE